MDACDAAVEASVAGWQRGEEAAVHAVFEVYYPKAVRLAALSGLPDAEAQDCAQETFMRAFERRDQLRDPAAFAAWFHRIATTQILAALKRRQRRFTREAPQQQLSEEWPGDRSAQPEEVVEAVEDREQLWRQIQLLPPRLRVAIVLRYFGDYSTREVAGMLGMREGSARVMLHRALRQLRDPVPPVIATPFVAS